MFLNRRKNQKARRAAHEQLAKRGEEVKTGGSDKPEAAMAQQDDGFAAIKAASNGGRTVILLGNLNTNITDKIDLSSIKRESLETRGTEGKGFQNSLGITSADLDAMITKFLEPTT